MAKGVLDAPYVAQFQARLYGDLSNLVYWKVSFTMAVEVEQDDL